jgi:hypothetical protein
MRYAGVSGVATVVLALSDTVSGLEGSVRLPLLASCGAAGKRRELDVARDVRKGTTSLLLSSMKKS